MGGLCDAACKFIEFYLKPQAETLPSHVRDTTDVLRRVDGLIVEEDMLLVTADVEQLYMSIRHEDGLRASRFYLESSNLDPDLRELVLELLEFILTHNFFVFKDRFFLQRQGTAMGAACAPSYANLFLGFWERDIFQGGAHSAPSVHQILGWYRYIDDVLFIWHGPVLELQEFMLGLNNNGSNIKLTYTYHQKEISFLDITLRVQENGEIYTDMYRKETSVNALLHFSSSHPPSTMRAIPIGQLLRARRICASDSSFERQAVELGERFRQRGYSRRTVKRGYLRAKHTRRNDLLVERDKTKAMAWENQPRFISTFNHRWEEMRQIFDKHWSVLTTDPTLRDCLSTRPLMTARRSNNIKDLLVHSHYVAKPQDPFRAGKQKSGFFPCGDCLACRNMVRSSTFTSSDGTREFKIKEHITCSTTFVVYYATCTCKLIYIGLTSRELRVRVREHVRDIKAAKEVEALEDLKPIPKHFRKHHNCNPRDLRVWGIEKIHTGIRGGDTKQKLAQRECRWIAVLHTLAPAGLNEQLSFSSFL
ncbi:unnamed protein product [Ranitomeya imitator]|uniref:Reverse transcriptase domain-containing protein n=1 Tax=Ranitomeya imitator TaxID=111125 RepID=A0ABN9MKW0_9NEOB|nr:unnamed protein product [Ranitomeya imitator]